jgi:hypothetical protein
MVDQSYPKKRKEAGHRSSRMNMREKESFISCSLEYILPVHCFEINAVVKHVDHVMEFIATHSLHF